MNELVFFALGAFFVGVISWVYGRVRRDDAAMDEADRQLREALRAVEDWW